MNERAVREIESPTAEVGARLPLRALIRAYCAPAPGLAARTCERLYMAPSRPARATRERRLFAEAEAPAEAAPNGRLHATEGLGYRFILMNRRVAAAAAEFVAGRA